MEGPADEFGRLRSRCERLLALSVHNLRLDRALAGMYKALKELKYWPPLVASLLNGDAATVECNADEAGMLSANLVRSVYTVGDLVAQVVNIIELRGRIKHTRVGLDAVVDDDSLVDSVRVALQDLAHSSEFAYFREFANATKHRQGVGHTVFATTDGHRLEFGAFQRRNGTVEPERDFDRILTDARSIMDKVETIVELLISRGEARSSASPHAMTAAKHSFTLCATSDYVPLANASGTYVARLDGESREQPDAPDAESE